MLESIIKKFTLFGIGIMMIPGCPGCAGSGDGGAFTVNDAIEISDKLGLEWEVEGEFVGPSQAGINNGVYLDTGFRGRFKARNNPLKATNE